VGLSLKEHNAISGLADVLYNFIPGSGNQIWSGHVTFASVATKVGVWSPRYVPVMLSSSANPTLTLRRKPLN
jgi:hypothetical protein